MKRQAKPQPLTRRKVKENVRASESESEASRLIHTYFLLLFITCENIAAVCRSLLVVGTTTNWYVE
jgi:hypothetical protein